MPAKIKMGNDEFILYIRKKSTTCNLTNDILGKEIWIWLRKYKAIKIEVDKPCHWGDTTTNTSDKGLPKTATQFEFDRSLLLELYNYLDFLSAK